MNTCANAAGLLAAMVVVTFGQDIARAAGVSHDDFRVETEAIIERVVKLATDSDEAKTAARLLERLGPG